MKTYQNMLNQIRRYLPTTPLEVEDQKLMLDYIKAYGKKAILKGMDLEDGATTIERNKQIGGHKA